MEQCITDVILKDLEVNGPIAQKVEKIIKENSTIMNFDTPHLVTNSIDIDTDGIV